MNNIPALSVLDENIGSIRDILFYPMDEVSEIVAPNIEESYGNLYQYNSVVALDNTSAVMYKLEFTEDTGEMGYKESKTPNGPLFMVKISALVPKDYSFRYFSFTEMQNHKFVVITRDYSNKARMHGYINLQGEKYGCTFFADFSTMKSRNGRNGYEVGFYIENIQRPYPMEEITSIPVDDGFPIDVDEPGGPINPDTD